jgi:hypothetical protein
MKSLLDSEALRKCIEAIRTSDKFDLTKPYPKPKPDEVNKPR